MGLDFKSIRPPDRSHYQPFRLAISTVFFESMPAMNKRQLINDIREYNTTATVEFLSQFDESALKQYLEHLEGAKNRGSRIASWVRKTPRLRLVS
jgi:hypothetical protein